MEFNLKRLLSFVVAFVMVLTMVPFDGLHVHATTGTATGSNAVDISKLPTAAQTKINEAKQIQRVADAAIAADDAVAYLNGLDKCPMCGNTNPKWHRYSPTTSSDTWTSVDLHVVFDADTANQTTGNNIIGTGTATATICIMLDNCNFSGTGGLLRNVVSTSTENVTNVMGRGSMHTSYAYGLFRAYKSGTVFNIYGGTFTKSNAGYKTQPVVNIVSGGVVNIFDGVTIGPATAPTTNTYNTQVAGALNMYGGTIQNGRTTTNYESANVYVTGTGTFNMYAGTVKGGYAVHGGNVYVCPNGDAYVYGTIENGYATALGGNIGSYGGNITIYGTVKDGESKSYGGNIGVGVSSGVTPASLTLKNGAEVSSGVATSHGGNIYVQGSPYVSETGVTVKDGTSSNYGGNIYFVTATASVAGSVYGGTAKEKALYGGNIAIFGGDVTISGTVGDDTIGYQGENIYAQSYINYKQGTDKTYYANGYDAVLLTLDGARLVSKNGLVDNSDYLGKELYIRRNVYIPTDAYIAKAVANGVAVDETLQSAALAANATLVVSGNTNADRILAFGEDSATYYQSVDIEVSSTFSGETELYITGDKYVCGSDNIHNLSATSAFGGKLYVKSNGQSPTKLAVKYVDGKLTIPHVAAEAVEENRKEATCNAEGSYDSVVKCATCSAEMSRTTESLAINPIAHNMGEYVEGVKTCQNGCGYSEECEHNWGEGVVTTAATCVAEGVKTYTCSICNHTKTEAVAKDAANHAASVTVSGQASTCLVQGWNEYVACTACGDHSAKQLLPLADHTKGEATIESEVAATCYAKMALMKKSTTAQWTVVTM